MSSLRGGALKGPTSHNNRKQHHNSPVQVASDKAAEEGLGPFELSEGWWLPKTEAVVREALSNSESSVSSSRRLSRPVYVQ